MRLIVLKARLHLIIIGIILILLMHMRCVWHWLLVYHKHKEIAHTLTACGLH